MTTTVKTWGSSIANPFSSAVDQAIQYREAVFGLHTALLAAGWTVERSCDSVSVSASNTWLSAANCVFGTETSQAHAWNCYLSPLGKGRPGAGRYRLMLNCNNSNADATPNNLELYMCYGAYTGGSTTTRASAGSTETAVITWAMLNFTGAITGRFCYWYTSDGDVYFGIKHDGTSFFRSFFMIHDDLTNSRGNFVMSMWALGNATNADVFTTTLYQAITNRRNFNADGTGAAASQERVTPRSSIWDIALWTNGLETSTNSIPRREADLFNNVTSPCRDLGLTVDAWSVPLTTPFNTIEDGDADPIRLRCISMIMLPTVASQGAIA